MAKQSEKTKWYLEGQKKSPEVQVFYRFIDEISLEILEIHDDYLQYKSLFDQILAFCQLCRTNQYQERFQPEYWKKFLELEEKASYLSKDIAKKPKKRKKSLPKVKKITVDSFAWKSQIQEENPGTATIQKCINRFASIFAQNAIPKAQVIEEECTFFVQFLETHKYQVDLPKNFSELFKNLKHNLHILENNHEYFKLHRMNKSNQQLLVLSVIKSYLLTGDYQDGITADQLFSELHYYPMDLATIRKVLFRLNERGEILLGKKPNSYVIKPFKIAQELAHNPPMFGHQFQISVIS